MTFERMKTGEHAAIVRDGIDLHNAIVTCIETFDAAHAQARAQRTDIGLRVALRHAHRHADGELERLAAELERQERFAAGEREKARRLIPTAPLAIQGEIRGYRRSLSAQAREKLLADALASGDRPTLNAALFAPAYLCGFAANKQAELRRGSAARVFVSRSGRRVCSSTHRGRRACLANAVRAFRRRTSGRTTALARARSNYRPLNRVRRAALGLPARPHFGFHWRCRMTAKKAKATIEHAECEMHAEIDRLRSEIERKKAEREAVQTDPLPADEVRARIDELVDGQGSVFFENTIQQGLSGLTHPQGSTYGTQLFSARLDERLAGIDYRQGVDLSGLLAYLMPDRIKNKLTEALEQMPQEPGLPRAERGARIEKLDAEIRDLETEEERLICDDGDEHAEGRRPRALQADLATWRQAFDAAGPVTRLRPGR